MKQTVLNSMRAISLLLNFYSIFFIPIFHPYQRNPLARISCQLGEFPQEVTWALVSTGIVVQILLVVGLGIPPLSSLQYLCDDLALVPLLVRLLGDVLCNLLLLLVVVEDAAAVLRADVGALAVGGGGIVHAVEVLDQAAVGDLGGVEDDLERFGVFMEIKSQRTLSQAIKVRRNRQSSTTYGQWCQSTRRGSRGLLCRRQCSRRARPAGPCCQSLCGTCARRPRSSRRQWCTSARLRGRPS